MLMSSRVVVAAATVIVIQVTVKEKIRIRISVGASSRILEVVVCRDSNESELKLNVDERNSCHLLFRGNFRAINKLAQ